MHLLRTRSPFAIGAAFALGGGIVVTIGGFTLAERTVEQTNASYVTADITLVAPKISGLIEDVLVEDNQSVTAGDVLARIDDRDFNAALAQAKADVEAANAAIANKQALIMAQQSVIGGAEASVAADEANERFAEQDNKRYAHLATTGYGSVQNAQQAAARIASARAARAHDTAALINANKQVDVLKAGRLQAEAELKRAEAMQGQAELNLSYTVIRAPIDGCVGRRTVRRGSYVNTGTALLAIVPLAQSYVIANFQENQLQKMRLNQPVALSIDALPGLRLRGHVDSLAPATDVAFSPIQPDNATGNFTKIVQRVPVKIVLEPGQEGASLLRVGMSVIPTVDISAPRDGPVTANR